MNRNEYQTLISNTPSEAAVISVDQLVNCIPRTLIYGYTLERHDFHVYIGMDDAIHVLVYRKVPKEPETGAERYLILDHVGPGGRKIERNSEFLPSKRAYPESCDFEFCRLLRSTGLHPSFTTFTERTVEQHETYDLYAGQTAQSENTLKGKPLDDDLRAHPLYDERARSDQHLSSRLLIQAANDLGVPADTYGGSAIVAESGAEAVLKKATEYLEGIKVADVQSSNFTSQLVTAAFGAGTYIPVGQPDLVNGRVSFTVHPEKVPFTKSTKFARYVGTNFDGAEAILGEFEGMPFLAAQLSENMVVLEVQQFGDRERCISQWMRTFNLIPVGKKKAAKTAAAE